LIVNIQGDEPLMKPGMIDQLVTGMEQSPDFVMGTLARPVESAEVWANPNVVKVVFGVKGMRCIFRVARYLSCAMRAADLSAARHTSTLASTHTGKIFVEVRHPAAIALGADGEVGAVAGLGEWF